jgi:hypothetical protein
MNWKNAKKFCELVGGHLAFLCSVLTEEVGDLGVAFLKLLFACYWIIMAEP